MRARVRIFAFAELLRRGLAAGRAIFNLGSGAVLSQCGHPFRTGFPPGSGADVITRYFAEKLRPLAGRTILVENRVGASRAISTEYTARSKPDGYTILCNAGSATAPSMHLIKNPPVEVRKAIEIVATINRQAFMVVVDAKGRTGTLDDLTASLKPKGDGATYATAAPTGIVMGEMYKPIPGVQAVEVRYKDASGSLNEILDGKIDYGMHDPVFSLSQAREGRLRVLAHSSGQRLQAVPEIPTMAEVRRAGHGPHVVVGRASAGCHAEAGDRSAQRLDAPDPRHRRRAEVPQQFRRRSVHQHARRGPGVVREGRESLGRLRAARCARRSAARAAPP